MIMLSNRGSETRRPGHRGPGKLSGWRWSGREDTLRPSSFGSTETRTPKPLNTARKRMGVGRRHQMGVSRDGLWTARAPEGSRAKKDTPPSTSPGKDSPTPRHLLSGGLPTLLSPLLTADHRELWFQAKALVPDSATSCLRAQVSWHLWGGSSVLPKRSQMQPRWVCITQGPSPIGAGHQSPALSSGPGSDWADVLGLACSAAACAVSLEAGCAGLAFWL